MCALLFIEGLPYGYGPALRWWSRKLSCCMAVLRFRWQDSMRGIQLPQQSVDDRPGVEQLGVGSQECRSSALRACTW